MGSVRLPSILVLTIDDSLSAQAHAVAWSHSTTAIGGAPCALSRLDAVIAFGVDTFALRLDEAHHCIHVDILTPPPPPPPQQGPHGGGVAVVANARPANPSPSPDFVPGLPLCYPYRVETRPLFRTRVTTCCCSLSQAAPVLERLRAMVHTISRECLPNVRCSTFVRQQGREAEEATAEAARSATSLLVLHLGLCGAHS